MSELLRRGQDKSSYGLFCHPSSQTLSISKKEELLITSTFPLSAVATVPASLPPLGLPATFFGSYR